MNQPGATPVAATKLAALPYAFRPRLTNFLLILLFVISSSLLELGSFKSGGPTAFHLYLTVVWTLPFPLVVVSLFGIWKGRDLSTSTFSGVVSSALVVVVPSVARKDTLPALLRVVGSLIDNLLRNFTEYRLTSSSKRMLKPRRN